MIQKWLLDVEKQSPELFSAVAEAYLHKVPAAKLAKAFWDGLKDEDSKIPEEIAGRKPGEWEHRIHQAFPELQGFSVVLTRKTKPSEAPGTDK
ncbi:unnamed protein product [Polarella glacialis]|uniref:Uncharacterized protein n=1 Tax=Polarella glacialis TaxID=89957 RepID=A0A813LEM6_POLGL|nr:unnamed protein product [Polarella glacialis]